MMGGCTTAPTSESAMSSQAELADRATLALIAADLQFFRDLAVDSLLEPLRSIASLALMPYLSAVVLESAEYLKRRAPTAVLVLQEHDELLRTSRLRVKLLDDDRRSLMDVLANAQRLAAINSGWFMEGHRGLLGALKRLLQPDLGIFFVQAEVICTTHVAFLNFGLTERALSVSSLSLKTLGPYLRGTTEDFGRYMAAVLAALRIAPRQPDTAPHAPLPEIRSCDVKSKDFYGAIARRVAPGKRRRRLQDQICDLVPRGVEPPGAPDRGPADPLPLRGRRKAASRRAAGRGHPIHPGAVQPTR